MSVPLLGGIQITIESVHVDIVVYLKHDDFSVNVLNEHFKTSATTFHQSNSSFVTQHWMRRL